MIEATPGLMDAVRDRFAHVDACPFSGERVFFENAGGALTLKSVVETSTRFAAIPDNPGRANPAGQGLVRIIDAIRNEDRATLIDVMSRHAVLFRSRLSGLIEGTMQSEVEFESI